jgi:hypothetical protein
MPHRARHNTLVFWPKYILKVFQMDQVCAVNLLLDLVQQSNGVSESKARFLQTSNGLREEGEMEFNEGAVTLNTLFLHQGFGFSDALGLILIKHGDHILNLLQVVSLEKSCTELIQNYHSFVLIF